MSPEGFLDGRVHGLPHVVPFGIVAEHHGNGKGPGARVQFGESHVGNRGDLDLADPHLADHVGLVARGAPGDDADPHFAPGVPADGGHHLVEDEVPGRSPGRHRGETHDLRLGRGRRQEEGETGGRQ